MRLVKLRRLIALTAAVVCSFAASYGDEPAAGPAEGNPAGFENAPVRRDVTFDGQALRVVSVSAYGGAISWKAMSGRIEQLMDVSIGAPAFAKDADEILSDVLTLADAGEIKYGVSATWGMGKEQLDSGPLRVYHITRLFLFRKSPQHVIRVRVSSPVVDRNAPNAGTRDNIEAVLADATQRARDNIQSDPGLAMMRVLASKPVPLGSYRVLDKLLRVEASVNDSPFTTLFYGNNGSLLLPAKMGDRVVLHAWLRTRDVTVSSLEIKAGEVNDGIGSIVQVGNAKGVVGKEGYAELDCGALADLKEMPLTVPFKDGGMISRTATIAIRGGRTEEAGLNAPMQHVSTLVGGPLKDTGPAACIAALLHDIEVCYNADKGCWTDYRAGISSPSLMLWCDIAAVRDLPLTEYPHLSNLVAKAPSEGIPEWIFSAQRIHSWVGMWFGLRSPPEQKPYDSITPAVARAIIEQINSAPAPLWQEGPTAEETADGWRDTGHVFFLAALWESGFAAGANNPLERILDYWVKDMEHHPDPADYAGYFPGSARQHYEWYFMRSQAVGALHAGYRIFKKPEYLTARDRQVVRYAEYLERKGVLHAISKKSGGPSEDPSIRSESFARDTADYVYVVSNGTLRSVPKKPGEPSADTSQDLLYGDDLAGVIADYGQLCAFTGDAEGLAAAREWIKAALSRTPAADGERAAFSEYQQTTFHTRCQLLAVMRGASPALQIPKVVHAVNGGTNPAE